MSEQVLKKITQQATRASQLREQYYSLQGEMLTLVGRTAAVSLARGGKIVFMGCGEDAYLCQAGAHGFVNGLSMSRPPLPALAFTGDSFYPNGEAPQDGGFSAQLRALGNSGDILIVVSSAPCSRMLEAMKEAKRKEMVVVGLFNDKPGDAAHYSDFVLNVPSSDLAIVSEINLAAIHSLCDLVDYYLFDAVMELEPYLAEG
ncbi:MAG: SIS domain-containing protein [Desulfovibrio sp.]